MRSVGDAAFGIAGGALVGALVGATIASIPSIPTGLHAVESAITNFASSSITLIPQIPGVQIIGGPVIGGFPGLTLTGQQIIVDGIPLLGAGILFFTKVRSGMRGNPQLEREAERMGSNKAVQDEANELIRKYLEGNHNPGLGTKSLFKDIMYLRGRQGARIFFRITGGVMEILGKASKANEQKVIKILTDLFG